MTCMIVSIYAAGDDFMAAHEVAMRPGLYRLSTMQRRLLVRAYETLDGIWEGYYIPRKGERY